MSSNRNAQRNKKSHQRSAGSHQKVRIQPGVYPYCLLSFAVAFILGLFLYDLCSTLISILINFGTAGAALFFLLSMVGITDICPLKIKHKKQKEKIAAGALGFLVAAVIVYFLCGIFGLRFGLTVTWKPGEELTESPTVESSSDLSPTETVKSHMESSLPSSVQNEEDKHVEEAQISSTQYNSTDPIMVTPNPSKPNIESIDLKSDFISFLNIEPETSQTAFTYSQKEFWRSIFRNSLEKNINTVSQPDSHTVNGNTEFSTQTKEANKIIDDMDENGQSEEKLYEVIRLHESAYAIYQTRGLCELLSNDYSKLAQLCAKEGRWELAYKNYVFAIKYRLSHIKTLTRTNDSFYCDVYDLAIIYQSIGDFAGLSTSQKIEADYISACFFELASQHIFEGYCNNAQFLSCYFAGMENHKLLYLTAESSYKASVEYFQDAYGYYEKSLAGTLDNSLDGTKYIKKNYEYLSQLCVWAQKYISTYGQTPNLLSKSEYKEKETLYHDNSR